MGYVEEEDASMGKNCMKKSCWEPCLCITFTFTVVCLLLSETSVYIHDVYVPALDTYASTGNGTAPFNASIFVDLKYHRAAATISISIEELELAVFYSHGTTPVAGYRFGSFDMGRHATVHKMAAMEAPELPWEEAFRAVSGGSTVELVVDLGKRRRSNNEDVRTAHVKVDASGHMASEGPIQF